MRDGLSLLDQAIALSAGGRVEEAAVRDMLGIADRGLVFDLLESVLRGDAPGALDCSTGFIKRAPTRWSSCRTCSISAIS